MPQLVITLVLIAVGWFFLIRPQQASIRAHRELIASLSEGDRVVTAGGIHGTITHLDTDADTVIVKVSPQVDLTVARQAIHRRLDAPNSLGGDAEEATS